MYPIQPLAVANHMGRGGVPVVVTAAILSRIDCNIMFAVMIWGLRLPGVTFSVPF